MRVEQERISSTVPEQHICAASVDLFAQSICLSLHAESSVFTSLCNNYTILSNKTTLTVAIVAVQESLAFVVFGKQKS
jgi:hypothetical protein